MSASSCSDLDVMTSENASGLRLVFSVVVSGSSLESLGSNRTKMKHDTSGRRAVITNAAGVKKSKGRLMIPAKRHATKTVAGNEWTIDSERHLPHAAKKQPVGMPERNVSSTRDQSE